LLIDFKSFLYKFEFSYVLWTVCNVHFYINDQMLEPLRNNCVEDLRICSPSICWRPRPYDGTRAKNLWTTEVDVVDFRKGKTI
jgi:hypothetical protein